MKNQKLSVTLGLTATATAIAITGAILGCSTSAKKTEAVPATTSTEAADTTPAPAEKVVAANLGAASAGRSR